MKVEVEIPDGNYCTGCPLSISVWTPWSGHIMYGCQYLHKECIPFGAFNNRAKKHPDCPSLRRTIKSPHKAGTIPLKDIKKAVKKVVKGEGTMKDNTQAKPPSKLNEYAYRIVKVGSKERSGQIEAKSRAEALGKLLRRDKLTVENNVEVVEGNSHLVAMIHCQGLSAHKHWEDDLWGAIIIWDIPKIEFTARR